jgi:hypothetical protein
MDLASVVDMANVEWDDGSGPGNSSGSEYGVALASWSSRCRILALIESKLASPKLSDDADACTELPTTVLADDSTEEAVNNAPPSLLPIETRPPGDF